MDNILFSYLSSFYILFNKFNVKIGTSKKKMRGPIQCLAIHGRYTQERP